LNRVSVSRLEQEGILQRLLRIAEAADEALEGCSESSKTPVDVTLADLDRKLDSLLAEET
jgi:hypothetical protein